MRMRCAILVFTIMALALALLIRPTNSPNTSYNEADTPFVAVLSPSIHVSLPAARQNVVIHHPPRLLPLSFAAEVAPLIEIPYSHPIDLPIVLHVLLC